MKNYLKLFLFLSIILIATVLINGGVSAQEADNQSETTDSIGEVGTNSTTVGGGGSDPYLGQIKYETVYISNSDLGIYGAGALGMEYIISKKVSSVVLTRVGIAGAATAIAAAINTATGNNGFKLNLTLTYDYHSMKRGSEVIGFTGWAVTSWSLGTY